MALALAILAAAPSIAAAATRYASPGSTFTGPNCVNVAAPCSLQAAMGSANANDTISLAAGRYELAGVGLAPVPLDWVATDPADPHGPPVLTSAAAAPTITLTPAQSGSSFDGVEIDNENMGVQPALLVQANVAASVRGSVVSGPQCIDAPDAGPLTIERSKISGTAPTTCLTLGAMSSVSGSVISAPSAVESRLTRPPIAVTSGRIEDSTVTGGLGLAAPTAVARRVRATGTTGITGEGSVVDSLATGTSVNGAGITANADGGGTLHVVNTTAVGRLGPGLLVAPANAASGPVVPNELDATNTIARGAVVDIEVVDPVGCGVVAAADIIARCPIPGRMRIDHSYFATRAPLATAAEAADITVGPGNITADPQFVDPAGGDYHLRAGSPAIDVGTPVDLAMPTDLDGRPRLQGAAPDLGAFESSPLSASPPPPPPPPPPPSPPHVAPVLSHLIVSPSAVRFGPADGKRSRRRAVRITFTLSEDATVRISFAKARQTHGHLRHCSRSCTRYMAIGTLGIHGRRGANTIPFAGSIRTGRRLQPGIYLLTAIPTDAAQAVGQPRTARLTVLP